MSQLFAGSFLRRGFPLAAMRSSLSSPRPSVSSFPLFRGLASSRGAPHPSESFVQGGNSVYMEEMYNSWLKDSSSVHKSWDVFFKGVSSGLTPGQAYQPPPGLRGTSAGSATEGAAPSFQAVHKEIQDHLKVQLFIRAFQVSGNRAANLDPLGINNPDLDPSTPPELLPESYGFTEKDMDRKFSMGAVGVMQGFLGNEGSMTLREIEANLKKTYCGTLGFEYMHISSRQQCNWIRERIEGENKVKFSVDDKKVILDRLLWADAFEKFIAKKWKSEKRFGLEGCEALIPGMKALIDLAADTGTENVVIGMPHRGRMNVLGNVVRKPLEAIFTEFSGTKDASDSFSGDVKYHLGMSFNRPTRNGKNVNLSLVANPSHLEAVNPVVMGKVRAMQYYTQDKERHKQLALLLHGDAAFAGQGVVYESLGLTGLPNYTTGGVIHLIVNNQIGFTTDPRFARSSPYCTDVAMTIQAPIFHVNSDDPEAVVFACKLAAEWRAAHKRDVIIDLICYRRHGHNEVDQPAFTQPLMYKHIATHPSTLEIYSKKLIAEGVLSEAEFGDMQNHVYGILENAYNHSMDYKFTPSGWTTSEWMEKPLKALPTLEELSRKVVPIYNTGVSIDVLKELGKVISSYPSDFRIHPGLEKIMAAKMKTIETGEGIDMPTAEALAFGSLLMEDCHVRLSGQDVERGTFSQRHAVLHDQENEALYIPLNNLSVKGEKQKERITVTNSHLSEYAVMGFELGYSMVNPNSLVIWEAQFGDFANTAQVMIDQFVASGETKWQQRSGLVLSLPHGYDGAGPEHSSGRMERFLQLCNDHPNRIPVMAHDQRRQIQDANLQVVYPSTPANLFHVLRRQIHRDFRKPLIIFFSKSLLRLPQARSSLEEMKEGTRFVRVYDEVDSGIQGSKDVKRVVFCSGQVYYTLLKARTEQRKTDVALVRIEQISPFPFDRVAQIADQYPQAEMVWAQEEHMNSGAWTYVEPRFRTALTTTANHKGRSPSYAGRDPSASTATGNKKQHIAEENNVIHQAFFGEKANARK